MDRAFFIGLGDYDLQLNTQALFSSLASNGAIVVPDNGVLNWAGSAQVTYSYDLPSPVPEPSTLVLLTLGLAGIRFSRRAKD
jgi:hypothetical protein